MLRRACAGLLTLLVAVVASIAWAVAAPSSASAAPVLKQAPGGLCSVEEWKKDITDCTSRLSEVGEARARCLTPPTPSTPDSGLAGWFAERPSSSTSTGYPGMYSDYGYAGYSYTTYDLDNGCAAVLIDPEYKFETTLANGEFMVATAIIGASNALRERAWDPETLWGWADPLVADATKAIYDRVFHVFGVITLAVIGMYLIWRSRQAEMGAATTTVGWAILVMVAVTAIAAWPVRSANIADHTLISTLGLVHDAVGPRPATSENERCKLGGSSCRDERPPAVRASDTATETMLYRNWLRGVLGSADSETAQKYGMALYDARSLSWEEANQIRGKTDIRDAVLDAKKAQWKKVAEQIKQEDPEAYEYLQGINGMERIGAGFIAVLAALMFAMFDLTASLLVLLGFLIFRWAVIAAPILGTIGLLRPASSGIRRLGNAVVAALFNIAIFGTGAAIYLFAVDLIMSTATLAGWLQVLLVWLCGVVGWLLLRPYRRITQLGGKDSTRALASAGSWHRRFFRDMREAAKFDVAEGGGTREPVIKDRKSVYVDQSNLRPEARHEDPSNSSRGVGEPVPVGDAAAKSAASGRAEGRAEPKPSPERVPGRSPSRGRTTWSEPEVAEAPASYSIYRPEPRSATPEPAQPRVRSEAK